MQEAAIRPLADITVVETYAADCNLALRLAGAMAGRIAADCGARVIMIEPHDGDPTRAIAPFVGGTSAIDAFLNRGKERVGPDAGHLGLADVAIADAATARAMRERPPVVAALSLFRDDEGHGPASEFTVMALGGLLDMVGDPARAPLKLAGHQAAYAAGLAAYTGVAAALCRPRVAGKIPRETVQVSMLDTVIWLNWKAVPARADQSVPTRTGSIAEWQVVRCADGFVALVYQEPDWAALCDVVDDARLRVPEFAERPERIRRSREIAAIVEERFLTLTRREIHALALARRIPLGPIWSPGDLRDDPQTRARDFLRPMPRLPVLWNGEPVGAPS